MPPRYSPRPFPRYRYLPGQTPHPTRDPDGHSYGRPEPALEHFDPSGWQDCAEYLYAIDLLNHGYWWEAHEAFEAIWHAAGQRDTKTGLFIQGLLQIGVGAMKRYLGQQSAAIRLWQGGLEKISLTECFYLGLDVHALQQQVRELIRGERESLPELVLHFDRENT